MHVELATRCSREHWLTLRAADLLGAELLAAGELTKAADLLWHFYHLLFVHELLIFFVWPAARAAKKLGTQQGAAIRTLVEREALRVKMSALSRDLEDCMNGLIP